MPETRPFRDQAPRIPLKGVRLDFTRLRTNVLNLNIQGGNIISSRFFFIQNSIQFPLGFRSSVNFPSGIIEIHLQKRRAKLPAQRISSGRCSWIPAKAITTIMTYSCWPRNKSLCIRAAKQTAEHRRVHAEKARGRRPQLRKVPRSAHFFLPDGPTMSEYRKSVGNLLFRERIRASSTSRAPNFQDHSRLQQTRLDGIVKKFIY